MSKKSKLETMSQTHGKVETFKPSSLEQILGDTGLSKYGTMDESVYTEKIKGMNKAELQAHASQVGLVPIDDCERLRKRLTQEFRLYVAQYRYPSVKSSRPTPISPEVAKILSEGK